MIRNKIQTKTIILDSISGSGFNLVFVNPPDKASEKVILDKSIDLIKNKLGFEVELNMLGLGLPPYCKFKEKNGIEVTIAIDDFDGISIDSNSKEFLVGIQPYFESDNLQ